MEEKKDYPTSDRVLVIGGGLGGIKAALDLAEAGKNVVIVDKAPAIGGLMTQLDRTFPTNNCDLCTLSPHLAESGRKLHIELMTLTRVIKVEGEEGNFKVSLKTEPRYIDVEKCTACGECLKKFPECIRFTPGLDHRAPTCMRYPQSTPNAFSVDIEKCKDMDGLVQVCRDGAILPEDTPKTREMEFGAIVLAPGAELFDPGVLEGYGYGAYPDVVTGLEYERILSASGPTHGELKRPSDGRQPQKIAWIQCVGSRGIKSGCVSYCSSACCMYALKEAIVTKERFQNDIETVVFYMDMRTSGKDYELYYQRAKKDFNIRFVRSRPHTVESDPETHKLTITYATDEDPIPSQEAFDMVVLSTGFRIPEDLVELSRELGIELNEHHFVKTPGFSPVATSKPGIYVCGLFESPKDIPETMVQASAAACMASRTIRSLEAGSEEQEEFPPERDVSSEEPKIGVFVCECGLNIAGVIPVGKLVSYARKLPGVVVAEEVGHGCSAESLRRIQQIIWEKGLNRVVIGGCSPRTHETLFQDTLRRAGLNRYLLEMANIRDQDTWVHQDHPSEALDKAKDAIRMAVSAVALAHPLTEHVLPMNKDVLVVGGGVTGMNAALSLADQGFKVYLVEKSDQLGGLAKDIHRTLEGEDVQAYMKDLVERTLNHENIQVITRAIIVDHTGMPGFFKTGLQVGRRMFYRQINHGVTILATGALANRPSEYLLGQHEAVLTQFDLDRLIDDEPDKIKAWEKVVMIQCVGSRTPENPNCSRICCQSAVKNALRILDLNPEVQISVLYRDMRTYGFQEDYFRKARERGVKFFRYDADEKPVVNADGNRVTVAFREQILNREVEIPADCLALSTGLVADDEGTEDLSMIFRLPRTLDGFFLEDHVKLRPVDLPVPGFFVAGTAHSPKTIRECITQAQAAAGRAQTLLARDAISLGAVVARVDGKKCAACLICVRACPFDVPYINADGYSEIDPAKCHGCGVCAAECPAKAIQLMQFEDDQIMAKLDGLFERIAK
ncbi:MAG: CoB--CoM heterodisulfide reductase iron-sulfur subunit A family protein [Deltaproteobacteria bacterium]|nr:CoB--CoM heterodisulfide reductase iron-sulfur subunit A family protein [Deltaproteobacteria bacterium]MBW2017095.1 CoB--CoM heterodisulfide reductase iron-sulfur subunit A family protein [Deltaproteobacteria bacterium]MBW2130020.1 CoB--CoM heterodisulfide reductase iron-sulfur subunit A family protein [Deltaproteobacteria bacterium]MBW2302982.1 CoB--CoM heterodisulfide reductase iron-sulfur subunit A family protein [Deltaproteobacteria bacterium]